jgi:hypothetical protein
MSYPKSFTGPVQAGKKLRVKNGAGETGSNLIGVCMKGLRF